MPRLNYISLTNYQTVTHCVLHQFLSQIFQLWIVLTNGEHLESRTSSQWTQIGFQGEDPQTDFRGMGMLGLDQLM